MKCKYCGFDSAEESIAAEGAPCGYKGCTISLCCNESWKDHMRDYHHVNIEELDYKEVK